METDKEIIVRSRGTCMKCGTKGSDCGLRSCPDISGLYKGVPFVVDCKNYASYAYIKDSDVAKIISDKEQGKYSIGFIITTEGPILEKQRDELKKKNCHFIQLGKVYSKDLKGTGVLEKFKDCFS